MESKACQPNHSPLRMQQLWDILEQAQHQLNDVLQYRAVHKTKWINKMMEILWEVCPNAAEAKITPEQRIPQNKHDKNKRKTELEISMSDLQNENNRLVCENEELEKLKHKMIRKCEIQKIILMSKEKDFIKEKKNREQQFAAREQNLLEQLHCKEKEKQPIKEENARLKEENARLKEENARLREENARLREENARLNQIQSSFKEDLKSQETDFKRKIESLKTHLQYLRLNNGRLKQARLVEEQQLSELRQECDRLGNRKREETLEQQKSKHEDMVTQQNEKQNTLRELDKKDILKSMSIRKFPKENDLIEEIETVEIAKLKQQNRNLAEMTPLKRKHTFKTVSRFDSNTACRDKGKTPAPVSYYQFADFCDELAIEREKTSEFRKEIFEIQVEKKRLDECNEKAVLDIKEKDQKLRILKQHVAKLQISRQKADVEKSKKELTLEKSNVGENKTRDTDKHIRVLQLQEEIEQRNIISVTKDLRRNITDNSSVGRYLEVEKVNSADAQLNETERENSQLRKEMDSLQEDIHKQIQEFVGKEHKLRKETEQIQKDLHDEILYLKSQLEKQRHQNEKLTEAVSNGKEGLKARETELAAANAFMQKEKDMQIHKLFKEKESLQRKHQRQTEDFKEKEEELRKEIEDTKAKMKNEIQSLTSEVERQRLDIEHHTDSIRNERERYKEKEEALEKENALQQEKFKTLLKELNSVKSEVTSKRDLEKQYQMLTLEVDNLRTENKQLTLDLTECQKKAFHKENSLENKLHELTTANQRLVKDLEHEKYITGRKKYTDSESASEEFQNEDMSTTQIVEALKEKLKSTTDELQATKRELDETKSRLSRIMGDRLTDNNPNVADLSDKNRPTKLSERYQELYDNQWTDAFETVSKLCGEDEERTIRTLQDILLDVMTFCKEEAENQMRLIIKSFCKGTDIPPHLLKQFKDSRKALAEEYGRQLLQEYKKILHKEDKDVAKKSCKIPDFVEECFNICWLLSVQDPPVVFGAVDERGADFNKDHYKAYTKGGDTVNYVVWPVLLLHEGGPVLCKGVAQGQMA